MGQGLGFCWTVLAYPVPKAVVSEKEPLPLRPVLRKAEGAAGGWVFSGTGLNCHFQYIPSLAGVSDESTPRLHPRLMHVGQRMGRSAGC